jgi:hypothetical protein
MGAPDESHVLVRSLLVHHLLVEGWGARLGRREGGREGETAQGLQLLLQSLLDRMLSLKLYLGL